jgi:hypothetical protein
MKTEIKNFVAVFEDAYSPEFCDKSMVYMDQMIEQGFGRTRQEHDKVDKSVKQDTAIFPTEEQLVDMKGTREIHKEFMDVFWNDLYPIYAEEFDVLKVSGEHKIYTTKMQRTPVGGGYHVWHCENNDKEHADRVMSFVLYLNDIEEGGETEFLYQHMRVKPKKGTLVLFPAAFTHVHRGNPPLTNTKYIITGWLEF